MNTPIPKSRSRLALRDRHGRTSSSSTPELASTSAPAPAPVSIPNSDYPSAPTSASRPRATNPLNLRLSQSLGHTLGRAGGAHGRTTAPGIGTEASTTTNSAPTNANAAASAEPARQPAVPLSAGLYSVPPTPHEIADTLDRMSLSLTKSGREERGNERDQDHPQRHGNPSTFTARPAESADRSFSSTKPTTINTTVMPHPTRPEISPLTPFITTPTGTGTTAALNLRLRPNSQFPDGKLGGSNTTGKTTTSISGDTVSTSTPVLQSQSSAPIISPPPSSSAKVLVDSSSHHPIGASTPIALPRKSPRVSSVPRSPDQSVLGPTSPSQSSQTGGGTRTVSRTVLRNSLGAGGGGSVGGGGRNNSIPSDSNTGADSGTNLSAPTLPIAPASVSAPKLTVAKRRGQVPIHTSVALGEEVRRGASAPVSELSEDERATAYFASELSRHGISMNSHIRTPGQIQHSNQHNNDNAAEAAADNNPYNTDNHHGSPVAVIIQDACYGHRYVRPRTSRNVLGSVVERPERLRASVAGIAAAYVRLGGRYREDEDEDPITSLNPNQAKTASLTQDFPSQTPSSVLSPESIAPTHHSPRPPFKIMKSSRTLPLTAPAVLDVHPRDWMGDLSTLCREAEYRLGTCGRELERKMDSVGGALHEGDLYLAGEESRAAIEGALGGVCDGIDWVCAGNSRQFRPHRSFPHSRRGLGTTRDGESSVPASALDLPPPLRRAFVAIRPPGHHCGDNTPAGFCWVNNVLVGVRYAARVHGITHAVVIDFDLHHGDGSQTIVWGMNRAAAEAGRRVTMTPKVKVKKEKEEEEEDGDGNHEEGEERENGEEDEEGENDVPIPVAYLSLHDINSYPCEEGDETKVQQASLCLENAHGQTVWNVHLERWRSERDGHRKGDCKEKEEEEDRADEARFWQLYERKYAVLVSKARSFLEHQAAAIRGAGRPQTSSHHGYRDGGNHEGNRNTATPRAMIFVSAGFDASELETEGMRRHGVGVLTGFYERITRDVIGMASGDGIGRGNRDDLGVVGVVSVLEGGYSDRALASGVLSHITGLCRSDVRGTTESTRSTMVEADGLSSSELHQETSSLRTPVSAGTVVAQTGVQDDQVRSGWWSAKALDDLFAALDAPPAAPSSSTTATGLTARGLRRAARHASASNSQPTPVSHSNSNGTPVLSTYSSPTQSFINKVADPSKLAVRLVSQGSRRRVSWVNLRDEARVQAARAANKSGSGGSGGGDILALDESGPVGGHGASLPGCSDGGVIHAHFAEMETDRERSVSPEYSDVTSSVSFAAPNSSPSLSPPSPPTTDSPIPFTWSWPTAAAALAKLLIPQDRPTVSITFEELNGLQRTRKARIQRGELTLSLREEHDTGAEVDGVSVAGSVMSAGSGGPRHGTRTVRRRQTPRVLSPEAEAEVDANTSSSYVAAMGEVASVVVKDEPGQQHNRGSARSTRAARATRTTRMATPPTTRPRDASLDLMDEGQAKREEVESGAPRSGSVTPREATSSARSGMHETGSAAELDLPLGSSSRSSSVRASDSGPAVRPEPEPRPGTVRMDGTPASSSTGASTTLTPTPNSPPVGPSTVLPRARTARATRAGRALGRASGAGRTGPVSHIVSPATTALAAASAPALAAATPPTAHAPDAAPVLATALGFAAAPDSVPAVAPRRAAIMTGAGRVTGSASLESSGDGASVTTTPPASNTTAPPLGATTNVADFGVGANIANTPHGVDNSRITAPNHSPGPAPAPTDGSLDRVTFGVGAIELRSPAKSPAKSPVKTPAKSAGKNSGKSPAKSPAKNGGTTGPKALGKSPAKSGSAGTGNAGRTVRKKNSSLTVGVGVGTNVAGAREGGGGGGSGAGVRSAVDVGHPRYRGNARSHSHSNSSVPAPLHSAPLGNLLSVPSLGSGAVMSGPTGGLGAKGGSLPFPAASTAMVGGTQVQLLGLAQDENVLQFHEPQQNVGLGRNEDLTGCLSDAAWSGGGDGGAGDAATAAISVPSVDKRENGHYHQLAQTQPQYQHIPLRYQQQQAPALAPAVGEWLVPATAPTAGAAQPPGPSLPSASVASSVFPPTSGSTLGPSSAQMAENLYSQGEAAQHREHDLHARSRHQPLPRAESQPQSQFPTETHPNNFPNSPQFEHYVPAGPSALTSKHAITPAGKENRHSGTGAGTGTGTGGRDGAEGVGSPRGASSPDRFQPQMQVQWMPLNADLKAMGLAVGADVDGDGDGKGQKAE